MLNGSYQEDEIFLNPLSWYEENNITLHAPHEGLRPVAKRAKLAFGFDGRAEPYDKLIIATGSRPFIHSHRRLDHGRRHLPARRVRVPHDRRDCREIAKYSKGKKCAAVIGGGLLGLEAARGLQNFGLEVQQHRAPRRTSDGGSNSIRERAPS